jgi:integrase
VSFGEGYCNPTVTGGNYGGKGRFGPSNGLVTVMSLSDTAIRKAKPADKPVKLTDGNGLYLLLTPAGSRWWRWDYRRPISSKRNTLSLGTYPDTGLADARAKRDDARKLLAAGFDPGVRRKSEKIAGLQRAANSFEVVAREWIKTQRRTLEPVTLTRAERMLELWAFPWLGSLPVTAIKPMEVLQVLKRLETRGAHETAHRLKQRIAQIFRYAIVHGLAEHNPASEMRGALQPVIPVPRAAITDTVRVGELLRAIDSFSGTFATASALKLAPMFFSRPGELRAAEWTEFDLDSDFPAWTIPASRRKLKRAQKENPLTPSHVVPLASQALVVLRELHALTGRSRYLFPGVRNHKVPMSGMTLNAALRRMGFDRDTMTAHGFRAMASTLLNELGWNPDAIERQLSHVDRDKVRAVYNRAGYLEERHKMMQGWADYLDELKAADSKKISRRK